MKKEEKKKTPPWVTLVFGVCFSAKQRRSFRGNFSKRTRKEKGRRGQQRRGGLGPRAALESPLEGRRGLRPGPREQRAHLQPVAHSNVRTSAHGALFYEKTRRFQALDYFRLRFRGDLPEAEPGLEGGVGGVLGAPRVGLKE